MGSAKGQIGHKACPSWEYTKESDFNWTYSTSGKGAQTNIEGRVHENNRTMSAS